VTTRTYTVYKGELGGRLVYVGTTIQKPADRFRWHKHNGKNFTFAVLSTHETPEAMLAEELRLILKHRPKYNKRLKQNLNAPLSIEDKSARVGNREWCQSCLTRRVNAGYSKCKWC
jgi:hypothetical protein